MAAPIQVKCMQCGKSLKLPASLAGKKGKCPVCSKIITVPDPSKAADTLGVIEDVSHDEVKKMAQVLANGTGMKEEKKKGFFARLFGK